MAISDTLRFAYGIKAPLDIIYRAFTSSAGLEEWLCQTALANPHPGGYLFLSWENGYFAAGEYTTLEPNHAVEFTWHGRGEPAISLVRVTLTQQEDSVLVVIEHRGLGIEDDWQQTRRHIEKGWIIGIENLITAMEEGYDRRIVDRPILGIGVEPSPASHGIPAGLRITDLLVGMSADQAGLQKDDIIVEMDEQLIPDYPAFRRVVTRHRAGDALAVTYYRSGEKHQVNVPLMRRPMAETPASAAELVVKARLVYNANDTELAALFQNVTDEEASHPAGEGEWSAKEVLAHLLHVERDFQSMIIKAISGQKFDFNENLSASMHATLMVYPSVQELLNALFLAEKETVALLANLPQDFVDRKASFWNICFNFPFMADHTSTHFIQIKAAIEAARTTP